MSRRNKELSQVKYRRILGIITSVFLFLIGIVLMLGHTQGGVLWAVVLIASFIMGVFSNYRFRRHPYRRGVAAVINIFFLAMALMVVDILAEEMGGVVSQGNGFLYDGMLADVFYLFIMIPLFAVSVGLMIPDWVAPQSSGQR